MENLILAHPAVLNWPACPTPIRCSASGCAPAWRSTPGWPWTDEMTAVALHKGNVYWELSGWAPKYFPPSLRADIRGRLREK